MACPTSGIINEGKMLVYNEPGPKTTISASIIDETTFFPAFAVFFSGSVVEQKHNQSFYLDGQYETRLPQRFRLYNEHAKSKVLLTLGRHAHQHTSSLPTVESLDRYFLAFLKWLE